MLRNNRTSLGEVTHSVDVAVLKAEHVRKVIDKLTELEPKTETLFGLGDIDLSFLGYLLNGLLVHLVG